MNIFKRIFNQRGWKQYSNERDNIKKSAFIYKGLL